MRSERGKSTKKIVWHKSLPQQPLDDFHLFLLRLWQSQAKAITFVLCRCGAQVIRAGSQLNSEKFTQHLPEMVYVILPGGRVDDNIIELS